MSDVVGEEGPRARSEQQQDGGNFFFFGGGGGVGGERGDKLQELLKHDRNRAQLPCAHLNGSLVYWSGGRWAKNWDALPAQRICEQTGSSDASWVLWVLSPQELQWKDETLLCEVKRLVGS